VAVCQRRGCAGGCDRLVIEGGYQTNVSGKHDFDEKVWHKGQFKNNEAVSRNSITMTKRYGTRQTKGKVATYKCGRCDYESDTRSDLVTSGFDLMIHDRFSSPESPVYCYETQNFCVSCWLEIHSVELEDYGMFKPWEPDIVEVDSMGKINLEFDQSENPPKPGDHTAKPLLYLLSGLVIFLLVLLVIIL
jgi:hypothetical protein